MLMPEPGTASRSRSSLMIRRWGDRDLDLSELGPLVPARPR
jgi:hypothetical protein